MLVTKRSGISSEVQRHKSHTLMGSSKAFTISFCWPPPYRTMTWQE